MIVGILGSGGREHAICHSLKRSKKIKKIYCFPGNAGTATISENVNIRNRKLDGSTRSENLGITLTTYIGKKKSSISSSNLNEKNLDNLGIQRDTY